ncbi:MAG: cation-transporting P-type ATPase, partial [bacterium]|nr:cation-transporting P-type ATPase [bacterium]
MLYSFQLDMFPNESGLTNKEAEKRQQRYGFNILPEKPPPGSLFLFVRQLKNPFIYILLFAAVVTLVIGHFSDAFIIFLAVFINTVLGFVQESKADNALRVLKHYITNKVTVVREGERILLNTSEIVPGDLVVLSQGIKIPAD